MMSREQIRYHLTGPVGSIMTPFHQDGSIDAAGMHSQIDRYIEGGSRAIILTEGDSLYTVLTDDEVAELTKLVVDHVAGRALVVAADRGWGLGPEVEFAKYAREVGADMLMAKPPTWAASCTSEDFVEYYAAVAEHIPVMVVTNVFADRGIDFSIKTLEMVRDRVAGVTAVKDDICGEFARKLGIMGHEHWALISGGQKQWHLNQLPYGCDGYLSAYLLFEPTVTHRYWAAIEANDWPAATEIIARYDMPLYDLTMALPGGFDAGMYGALELVGICQRWRRKPYHTLTDEELAPLADFFKDVGVL